MPAVLQRREIGHLEAWATRRPHKPIVIRGGYDLLSLPLYLVGQARRLVREAAADRRS